MNKLLVSLTAISVLALFNAYSSFAQAGDTAAQVEKQSAKQEKSCSTSSKDCCKSEKTQPGHCCACCSGTSCNAKPDTHCCG